MNSSIDENDNHDNKPVEYAAVIELGDNFAKVCVRNMQDLPSALNQVAEATRKMVDNVANQVSHDKTPTAVNTVATEKQSNTTTPLKRKMNQEGLKNSFSSPKRVAAGDRSANQTSKDAGPVLLQEDDPLSDLGWKTLDCGMWNSSQGDFPDPSFTKQFNLGKQCPGDFVLLPELYRMEQGWTYKYAKCTCSSSTTTTTGGTNNYCAMIRLVCPALQDDTLNKCFLIQVATEDFDQAYCQHHGDEGGAHVAPGGEFAMEKLRQT